MAISSASKMLANLSTNGLKNLTGHYFNVPFTSIASTRLIAHVSPPLGQSFSTMSSSEFNRNRLDHKRRLLAAKYELRRKFYKSFCKDPTLPSEMRDKHRCKLSKLPRNSSFTRVRNRCIFTGRPRAVYKFFRISRIVFRGLASRGSLMGIKKSSW